jgi:hypothetical protein
VVVSADPFFDLRERLERLEAARVNPYMRLRLDEVRALLDALDGRTDSRVAELEAELAEWRRVHG